MAATAAMVCNAIRLPRECLATSVLGKAIRKSYSCETDEVMKLTPIVDTLQLKFEIYMMTAVDALVRFSTTTCLLMNLKTSLMYTPQTTTRRDQKEFVIGKLSDCLRHPAH